MVQGKHQKSNLFLTGSGIITKNPMTKFLLQSYPIGEKKTRY
jgi:hypothetical protein